MGEGCSFQSISPAYRQECLSNFEGRELATGLSKRRLPVSECVGNCGLGLAGWGEVVVINRSAESDRGYETAVDYGNYGEPFVAMGN